MTLVIRNLQRVLALFDRLIGMAPPAPIETFDFGSTSLDARTPYEVSMSDAPNQYYTSRWASTGFMTSAPPLLDMFKAAMRNESVLSRATLASIPLNYAFLDIRNTLEYARFDNWWSGNGYCVIDAAMTIMISSRLPKLRLVGHPSNFTFTQLLNHWEDSALATLKQANYSWEATWFKGTDLDGEESPGRLLMSGVFVHLYRRYGRARYSFLQRFFHSLRELANRMPVYWDDSERFRGGYFLAASMAAPDADLLPFFTQQLRWDISPAVRQYLRAGRNLPRR